MNCVTFAGFDAWSREQPGGRQSLVLAPEAVTRGMTSSRHPPEIKIKKLAGK